MERHRVRARVQWRPVLKRQAFAAESLKRTGRRGVYRPSHAYRAPKTRGRRSKPVTLKVPVTERALVQRINRALPDGERIKIGRSPRRFMPTEPPVRGFFDRLHNDIDSRDMF